MYRVGFYLGSLTINSGGIAPYAKRICSELTSNLVSDKIELTVLGKQLPKDTLFRKAIFHFSDLFYLLRNPHHPGRRAPHGKVFGGIYREVSSIDLIHFPIAAPPRLGFSCPYIVTIHDLQELHFPENFSPSERAFRAMSHCESVKNAAAIVVSFQHVKDDVCKYFGIDEDKVHVLDIPIDQCKPIEPTLDFQNASNFVNKKYLLYPAQTWQHKNHIRLIQAFEASVEKFNEPLELVCTGFKNSFFGEIDRFLANSKVKNSVHFLGAVSEQELSWLYRNAHGVVVPTLYEAGSFPLMESMLMNLPVICSNVTSLPDTIGDERFTFNPYNIKEMSNRICQLVSDEWFRNENLQNNKLQIEKLKQIKVAKKYEELWLKTLSETRPKK